MCHSCTNLVHGIVPEVYYLHEVCHSCVRHNLVCHHVHGSTRSITPRTMDLAQEQWIMTFCSTNWHPRSQKEAVQFGRLTRRLIELAVSCACTFLAFTERAHCSPHRWFVCVLFKIVSSSLGTVASRGNAYPMMPHGRPGRGSKTHNQARSACAHLKYNAVVWVTAGWRTSCR